MRKLQLVMAGVWGLFALASFILTIVDFGLFTLMMAIGCSGLAVMSFLSYRWSSDQSADHTDDHATWGD